MSETNIFITLAEMAKRLSRTPEKFKKEVIKFAIPHLRLGDDRLLNPEEVANFLSSQSRDSTEKEETNLNSSILKGIQKSFEISNHLESEILSQTQEANSSELSNDSETLLSEKQAAEFLGVSKVTLFRKRKVKEIKHYRIGVRILYSKREHLIPFLIENEQ